MKVCAQAERMNGSKIVFAMTPPQAFRSGYLWKLRESRKRQKSRPLKARSLAVRISKSIGHTGTSYGLLNLFWRRENHACNADFGTVHKVSILYEKAFGTRSLYLVAATIVLQE